MMPSQLNYEPRDGYKPEPPGPSDRAGTIIAALMIFFILSGLYVAFEGVLTMLGF